ncbi:uncharacterized protein LOC129582171 [Paramacrobiotus metropolitanus]|uniref:uncharacterized protein LOC129582171 n=1 Tax=Paramacrobiotus metropolitanus TaxID=2943436 RepID=UPI0024457B59|nr:uncharacterized protein LOC129582171 [Paramacrobiotus metropolitanus]
MRPETYETDDSVHESPPPTDLTDPENRDITVTTIESEEDHDGSCSDEGDVVCLEDAEISVVDDSDTKEIDGIPVISTKHLSFITNLYAAELIFKAKKQKRGVKVATRVPHQVQRTSLFVIKLSCLASPGDVLSDSNGRWEQSNGKTIHFYRWSGSDVYTSNEAEGTEFRRYTYTNFSEPTFKRVIVFCRELGFAVLQYYFSDKEDKSFAITSHGKERTGKPYERMYESTKEKIKKGCESGKDASTIRADILEEVGPIENLASTAQIPSAFVREVVIAPDLIVMLALDTQLDDLVRFAPAAGMSVDTTFNVGEYYVTTVVTRHLMLRNRTTRVSPVIIGVTFIHKRKTGEAYQRMAAMLLNVRPQLTKAKFLGTDGDKALYGAFQTIFPTVPHILCIIHAIDNISRKAEDFKMSNVKDQVLALVFGRVVGDQRVPGYIDCETPEDYEKAGEQLRLTLGAMHANGPKLAEYFFKSKAPLFQEHYSAEARKAANVGAGYYNQNAVESANKRIKKGFNSLRGINRFVKDMEIFAKKDLQEFEYATIKSGLYEIIPAYKHLEADFKELLPTSEFQKRAFKKGIHREPFSIEKANSQPDNGDETPDRLTCHPHGEAVGQIKTFSRDLLASMLEKADVLLQKPNPIVLAPGSNGSRFLVCGHKPGQLLTVTLDGNLNRIECDKTCSHYVTFVPQLTQEKNSMAPVFAKVRSSEGHHQSAYCQVNRLPMTHPLQALALLLAVSAELS